MTSWCTSASLNSRANSASGALIVAEAPCSLMSFSSTAPPSGLRRRTHDDVAPARTGNRALDQQQLPLGIDAHDRQVLNGAPHIAQLPGPALAGEHPAGALALTGRTRRARRYRVSVRLAIRRKMMALDHAGESLAERRALHVHLLPDLEDLDADLSANFQRREFFRGRLEFAQQVARLDCSLGQVSGERLPDAGCTALAERDLHGGIAVVIGRLDLSDPVVGHVE